MRRFSQFSVCSVSFGFFAALLTGAIPAIAWGQSTVPNARVSGGDATEAGSEEAQTGGEQDASREEARERKGHRDDAHREGRDHHHHHHRHGHHRYRKKVSRSVVKLFGPSHQRRDELSFEMDRIWVSVEDKAVRIDYEVDRSSWETCYQPARAVYLTLFVQNEHGFMFRQAVPLAVRSGAAHFADLFGVSPGDEVGVGVVVVGPMVSGRTIYPGYIVHQPTVVDVAERKSRLEGEAATLKLDFYSTLARFPWFGARYGFGGLQAIGGF